MAVALLEAPVKDHLAAFPTPHCRMVTAAILAGNTGGRLWADAAGGEAPGRLLWDQGNNVFYLSGRIERPESQQALRELVETEIRGEALRLGKAHFSARALPPAPPAAVETVFGAWLKGKYSKRFYAYPFDQPPDVRPMRMNGVRLAAIDADLLGQSGLENLGEVIEEIGWMWPSLERFLQAGFGVAARIERRLACWCTAEYVSPQACGIGIATHPPDQGLGLATAVTAAFIAESLRRGLRPHWECAAHNAASLRVAEKCGFVLVEDHPFFYGELSG
jgi:GNAT superfamily N-acetyltransferase